MVEDSLGAYQRIKARMKVQLVDLLDGKSKASGGEVPRAILRENLAQVIKASPESRGLSMSGEEQERLIQDVLNEVVGLGPLDPLLSDPTITEIMVNGPHEIFIERNGRLERVDAKFRDTDHLMSVIDRMLGTVGVVVNESSPLCDASLRDGARINVIIPPLVLNGPVVTIRRKGRDWTMQDYLAMNALSEQAAEFLQACVKAKVNIVISGGTSTGKTTLVTILSAFIPRNQRIITIENVPELELLGREHWIRLVARQGGADGRGEVPVRALVKNALRMRPDRIILGEARGGEALDVVQAMHSGHDGIMTVLHGNTPRAALERLETLMLMSGLDLPPAACRTQIASAVDLVVHVSRYADGTRRVAAVSQLLGTSQEGFQLEDVFVFEAQGFAPSGELQGTCRYTGVRPKALPKFHLNNVEVPAWLKA